jgi:glycosyltransferase involved in cell wall biosynthesis
MMEWQPQIANKSDYTIGYVGSFYYSPVARKQMLKPWWKKRAHRILQYIPHKQDWLYRSPYFFFKAMKQFNSAYPDLEKRIKVKFAGKKQDWLQEMIREFGLEQQVTLMGEISHKESLLFQRECDALLITSAKQFGGRDYSIAGKTFEYLQMQRPIIAFVCEGAQKDLLENAGTALLCNPDNTEESVKQLAELFNGQISLKPVDSFLKGLSRAALTERLSEILKKISRHI